MKISTLGPPVKLQSAFPLHLNRKLLFKYTCFQWWLGVKKGNSQGVWRRDRIYTSSSFFTSAVPAWCPRSSPPVQTARYSHSSKDAVQWCTQGTQRGLVWVSGFPAVITEGFDFCSLVFWIICSGCPKSSAPCKWELARTHVYKLNNSISFIFILCQSFLYVMSIVSLSTASVSPVCLRPWDTISTFRFLWFFIFYFPLVSHNYYCSPNTWRTWR